MVQSMPDASPTKWHRAHTTWFFEQFLLVVHAPGYRVFDEDFAFLFNSYYVAAGPRHARPRRGLLTRPSCEEVTAYRTHVDQAVERLLAKASGSELSDICRVLEIGLHHEQQHQELLLTDILHAFAENPIAPAMIARGRLARHKDRRMNSSKLPSDIHTIGFEAEGYCFDNEAARASSLVAASPHRALPRHQCAMARIHGGRRLRHAVAMALRRLGRMSRPRMEGAGLLAQARRRLVHDHARRAQPDRTRRAGLARELLRGGRFRALGRQAPADRG